MGPEAPPVPLVEQPATAYCIVTAAHRYNIPVDGLLSILLTEGGRPGMASPNENGTFDLGVMQVNTVWLKPKSPLYGYVTADALKNDLCVNIHAAAWILASQMIRAGDIWRGVGRYHSPGNSALAWGYMNRVNGKLRYARRLVEMHPTYVQTIQAVYRGVSPAAGTLERSSDALVESGRRNQALGN